jgi:hypothetical protein
VVEEAGEETLAAPTFAGAETQALLREMFEYLSRAGMRIVLAEDPYAELRLFLQGPPRKRKDGRPLEDNELRNFMIALDVIRRANGGMKLEDAYEKIGKAEGLKPKTVEAHYRAGLKSQLMKPPFPGEGEWEIWPPGN